MSAAVSAAVSAVLDGAVRTGRGRRERGSATVYALVACMLLVLACVVGLQVAALARLQHKVSAAADLAALAASRATVGGEDGCRAAARIADANHAELVSCEMAAEVATLEVAGTTPPMWGRSWTVRRTARAGPADYVDDRGEVDDRP
ncbi:MAG: Rv3654c family TadE-like protein [Nocardioidaceae bacterium]